LASARSELDATSATLEATTADLDAATADLGAASEREATLRAELGALVSERDALVSERDALVSERDDLADRLALAEAASASAMQRLDETAEALDDAQGRAARLTGRLSELIEEQAGLQETTQAQRDTLASVRADLEATQTEIARLTGARGIYTVQGADSLSSIATFFYRDGNRWPDILAANDNLIDDPDLIFAGMVLIIPE
jgi:nucleoid-associated protein YgaU